jgi:hypothetical protein
MVYCFESDVLLPLSLFVGVLPFFPDNPTCFLFLMVAVVDDVELVVADIALVVLAMIWTISSSSSPSSLSLLPLLLSPSSLSLLPLLSGALSVYISYASFLYKLQQRIQMTCFDVSNKATIVGSNSLLMLSTSTQQPFPIPCTPFLQTAHSCCGFSQLVKCLGIGMSGTLHIPPAAQVTIIM